MALSDEDVREILRIIDESKLDELQIQVEGFSLHVRKGRGAEASPALDNKGAVEAPAPRSAETSRLDPQAETAAHLWKAHEPESAISDGLATIESPMLGTFYRAESPGARPFVEPGSRVEPDTIVCIIEVMKMMNSVPAGISGEVVELCTENAELVEYGQPLFRVQPA